MKMFILILSGVFFWLLLAPNFFSSRHPRPLTDKEIVKDFQTQKSELAQGLSVVTKASSARGAALPMNETNSAEVASAFEQDNDLEQLKSQQVMESCMSSDATDLLTKKECLGKILYEQNLTNAEKQDYFRNEIFHSNCLATKDQEACQKYLVDCLASLSNWHATRQELESLIAFVSRAQSEPSVVYEELTEKYNSLLQE